jgi:uncharacterized protein (DUF433 family)
MPEVINGYNERVLGQPQAVDTRRASAIREHLTGRALWTEVATQGQVAQNRRFLERKLAASPADVQHVVTIEPGVLHGNPVFRNTRIPLYIVVEELAEGASVEDILEGYPALSRVQIQASLDFIASLVRIYDDKILGG